MSISWTFPYFSGAANFKKIFDWQISPIDYDLAAKLSFGDYLNYRHQQTVATISYGLNSYGYVLVALLSRTIFYWAGDVQGVIYLQLLVHLLISLFIVSFVFVDNKARFLFITLYAASPLVVYFVTFPFYYFWLSIPSACFATLLLKPAWRKQVVIVSTPLLLSSLLIRPTTIFLSILFYAVAYRSTPKVSLRLLLSSLSIFIAGLILFSSVNPRLPPWHTMYIGFGAYKNSFGLSGLSDEEGYKLFYRKTGVQISTNPITGNWGKPVLMNAYNKVIKEQYFHLLTSHPWVFIKNSLLNLGQVFSVGYIDKRPLLSILSSCLGWGVITYLLLQKEYSWFFAITSSALCFFWYFPPIPAYNFSSYMLLTCAIISSLPASRLPAKKLPEGSRSRSFFPNGSTGADPGRSQWRL
jgi:hypothetical protein